MEIFQLLSPDGVAANLKANSKKQALQELSARAARITGQPERAIFDVLLERERLGTTGVGNAIAIPHGRPAGLDKLYGLFARVERPIDFDSIDEMPVDLIRWAAHTSELQPLLRTSYAVLRLNKQTS